MSQIPLHHPPILPYNGLTFILSKPSRFDKDKLISGYVSKFFDSCLSPYTRYNCDIRLAAFNGPLLPNTKVVILLGREAQVTITPLLTLNEARGYCYERNRIVYIATYFPQDCIDRINYEEGETENEEQDIEEGKEKDHSPTRKRNYKFWFFQDIQKGIRLLREGFHPQVQSIKYTIYPPSYEIINLLSITKNKNLFLDIETNDNYKITVFSFSFDSTNIYCVPLNRYTGVGAYGELETCKILRSLSIAFRSNTVIIHNALFDLLILAWQYKIIPPLKVEDTMLLWHRLYPEVEKSLGHVISYYLYEEFHKNSGNFNPQSLTQEETLWRYNAKDVATLALCYKEIKSEYSKLGLESSCRRVNSFIRPYLLQSLQGSNIDNNFKLEEFKNYERLKIQYLRILKILLGYDIEKISPKRISTYLYDYLKIDKPNATYRNGIVEYEELTASLTLYKLLLKHDIPAIKVFLAYRHIGKKSGFLKFLPFTNPAGQSRFTCSWKIAGTNTLRLASSKLLGLWGSNAQNIEKKLRKVIIADEGKNIVQTDQFGAEALIVAYLAPKGNYRKLFENNIKPHSFVALHLFRNVWEQKMGKSLDHLISCQVEELAGQKDWQILQSIIKSSDDWPPRERYYCMAKKTCHSANYNASANRLLMSILQDSEGQIVLSKNESEYFLNTYHMLFPEIRIWHSIVIEQLNKDRTLYNLFGDRRIFFGYWDDSLFREAFAFVPQSTVGVLTSVAISEIQQEIDNHNPEYEGIDILLNCHDACISQCLIGNEKKTARLQEKHLAKEFKGADGTIFYMKSESSYGPNWGELKPL